jgi:hypothetical protein
VRLIFAHGSNSKSFKIFFHRYIYANMLFAKLIKHNNYRSQIPDEHTETFALPHLHYHTPNIAMGYQFA